MGQYGLFSKIKRLSFRLKLMLLVASVLILTLASYLYIGTSLFVRDKTSYVYELSHVKINAAAQTFTSLLEQSRSMSQVLVHLSKNDKHEQAYAFFSEYRSRFGVQAFGLYRENFSTVRQMGSAPQWSAYIQSEEATKCLENQELCIYSGPTANTIGVFRKLPGKDSDTSFLLLPLPKTLLNLNHSDALMLNLMIADKLLINEGRPSEQELFLMANRTLGSNAPNGVKSIKIGTSDYLVGFLSLFEGQVRVLSVVSHHAAFDASKALIIRSIVLGISVLCFALGLSLILVRNITFRLRNLWVASQKVTAGDFSWKLPVTDLAEDDLGVLTRSFNTMSERISWLIRETAEKSRLETELKTAQHVQKMLFPEHGLKTKGIEISGYFEPATECGGDWWHYSDYGDKFLIWIGDVTGHGASAALLTSAAKACATMIEDSKLFSPASILEKLNRVIFTTARGDAMMTFVVIAVDLNQKTLTYANAGHNSPLRLTKVENAWQVKVLTEAKGLRLGEGQDTSYIESTMTFEKGDSLILYTDGVIDLTNFDGQAWKRKMLLKSFQSAQDLNCSSEKAVNHILGHLRDFQGAAPLLDDLTLVHCNL